MQKITRKTFTRKGSDSKIRFIFFSEPPIDLIKNQKSYRQQYQVKLNKACAGFYLMKGLLHQDNSQLQQ